MIGKTELDLAYDESKRAMTSPQLGIRPGDLGRWIADNLPKLIEANKDEPNEIRPILIAVELVGIGIIAARHDERRN